MTFFLIMRHDLFVQHVEHTLRAVDCRARADMGLEEKGQQTRPALEVQHVHIRLRPDCPNDGPGDIMRHPYPARVFASRHEYKRIGREYDEYGDEREKLWLFYPAGSARQVITGFSHIPARVKKVTGIFFCYSTDSRWSFIE